MGNNEQKISSGDNYDCEICLRLAVNQESEVKSPTEDVAETGQKEDLTSHAEGVVKMPINGGTRMLRARRKDINVKPNRRLDRKSSRGMLFENEELRMRTITINAEVEQGQHALKKLRRENEQLRREMWSLRDEYDKMEKLLRKKEEDDEDSDQEISDSDENDSQTEDAGEEEKKGEEAPGGKFENAASARAFDGLSVIDEQTEETTTQTTETGCGTGSRGGSANRTLNQVAAPAAMRMYEEHPGYPFYDSGYQPKTGRRKAFPVYENDPGYVAYGATGWPDNGYDARPASPYPYPESVQPSYQKRFQVLQNLPPVVASRVDENGWVFPNAGKADYDLFPREPGVFVGGPFLPNKSLTSPISIQIPQQMDYDVVRDRTGPDVFVSDVCAEKDRAVVDAVVGNVGAEMEKIEIGEAVDGNAKSAVSQDGNCKAVPDGKLTTAKSADEGDGDRRGATEDSVPGQNPSHKDVRPAFDSEDMARADKTSKFQSKLTVTLKTPASKPEARMPKRVPPVQVPRTYQTIGYAPKTDYRGKICGFPECRYVLPDGAVAAANLDGVPTDAEDIPVRRVQDGLGLLTEVDAAPGFGVKPIKIPPAPPPRTTSSLGNVIPDPATPVPQYRTFGKARSPTSGRAEATDAFARNPLMLSEPMATSSPTIRTLGLDDPHRRPVGIGANDESSAEDVSARRPRGVPPHLNKSVSSPSFGTFLRRKPSEHSVSSVENGATLSRQADRKISRGNPQNNVSVSSSSGLDSPTKSDRRKRRVSIKFNKKSHPEDGVERSWDSRQESAGLKHRGKLKSRHEETDVTTSERERTNSASSRASSGEGRRKLSVSSSRTYVNDDKIPWCGCWGNGCV
ncbi:UNVERIFIED_CONTAM: hypothetical protein PYX00_004445 [Menopon gallinae]|uniref:Uncharacterized protein n=2 Tax=Menopon gallinae TaxID=328185 RepID=A0AAW2I5F1_9NEOP